MNLQQLNEKQISKLYEEHMIIDFPKDELKPLEMILKSVEKGFYECLGILEEEKIVGYIYLVRVDNCYLIDYIAIFPELRNKGLGTNLLALINDYLETADRVIGEVEDPAYTNDEGQKHIRNRRLQFYLRNNCRDTGLRVECFGVNYIILEVGNNHCKDLDEVWNLYEKFYKIFLPTDKFIKNIKRLN